MKDQTELAPCPFCGGKAMENQRGEIQCSVAVCRSVESMPADAWNSRPDLRRIKELEELVNTLNASCVSYHDGAQRACTNINNQAKRIRELEEKVKELESRISKPWSDPL